MTYSNNPDEDTFSTSSMCSLGNFEEYSEDLQMNDCDEPEHDVGDGDGGHVNKKRTIFGIRTSKDISMDLNDLLAEMEEEREESQHQLDSSSSTSSLSHAFNEKDDDDDDYNEGDGEEDLFRDLGVGERIGRMGSKLKTDELPFASKGSLNWGSVNWGSFMGSFRKRGNSSRKLGSSRRLLGIGLGSSRRLLRRKKSSLKQKQPASQSQSEPSTSTSTSTRKKVVRFLKFETVFPSHESFMNLHHSDSRNHNC